MVQFLHHHCIFYVFGPFFFLSHNITGCLLIMVGISERPLFKLINSDYVNKERPPRLSRMNLSWWTVKIQNPKLSTIWECNCLAFKWRITHKRPNIKLVTLHHVRICRNKTWIWHIACCFSFLQCHWLQLQNANKINNLNQYLSPDQFGIDTTRNRQRGSDVWSSLFLSQNSIKNDLHVTP